jgi:hypothetical protein
MGINFAHDLGSDDKRRVHFVCAGLFGGERGATWSGLCTYECTFQTLCEGGVDHPHRLSQYVCT